MEQQEYITALEEECENLEELNRMLIERVKDLENTGDKQGNRN